MPQLTDQFGPIYQSVVLNGSGGGTVTFQPNGKNARITTLFVKASTSVLQAQVALYKGVVADSTIVGSTVSGSTGAPAFGNIDLQDGETLFVVWTGGDAGATATATFVGHTIPFSDIKGTELRWSDPIASNDGSLVFPAIKSPNFTTGVIGWEITREGSAEFNNITVRGIFEAVSPSGSNVIVSADAASATVSMQPPTFGGETFSPGTLKTTSGATGTLMLIEGPGEITPTNIVGGELVLGADNTIPGSIAQIVADQISLFGVVTLTGDVILGSPASDAVSGDDTSVTSGQTTSTTFVNSLTTSGIRGIAFVAPPSGNVFIYGTAGAANNTINDFTYLSFEVRAGNTVGSGTVFQASDENTASEHQSTVAVNSTDRHVIIGLVTGLTPGTTYNTSLTYRVNAGTGNWNRRRICVLPTL